MDLPLLSADTASWSKDGVQEEGGPESLSETLLTACLTSWGFTCAQTGCKELPVNKAYTLS